MPALITWGVLSRVRLWVERHQHHPVCLSLPAFMGSLSHRSATPSLPSGAGADKSYPEAEKREADFERRVEEYHAKLAAQESHPHVKDTSLLTKIIRAVWIVVGLAVPAVLAWRAPIQQPRSLRLLREPGAVLRPDDLVHGHLLRVRLVGPAAIEIPAAHRTTNACCCTR